MQNKFSFSTGYRSQAIRTVFAIIFFIVVYLTILTLSFALVGLIFYSAILLLKFSVLNRAYFYIFILFLLLNFVAVVLLVFIIKFFFRKQTVDRSGWLEINREQQPKLFELIESISNELETNFPQKVYLGAGVEAMVFYDSNFRNLFFPSKENLMIGLGLVNTMSESELKVILAHEFGHFTQRSLNVYSYLYIENQVIYKMLIDEEFYQNLLLKFFVLGKFTWIVIYYSRFIRWVLRKTYEVVSKSYMALSREMEFQSDEISASVVGSKPAISALLRTGLASDSFNFIWQFYYSRISENIKTENVYPQHKHAMIKTAERYEVEIKDEFPQVTKEIISTFNRSKLIIENQWASHPTVNDRIKKLEALNIISDVSNEPAWNFFINSEDLQKEITEKLFRNWQFAESPVNLTLEQFKVKYSEEVEKYSYDKKYRYFYEFRDISVFDLKVAFDLDETNDFKNFNELYSEKNVEFIRQFTGLDADLKVIESISKKEIKIDNFEYGGVKYQAKKVLELLDVIMKLHKAMYEDVKYLDMKIFRYFYKLSKLAGRQEELIKCYETYFYFLSEDKTNLQIYLDLINSMQFIYKTHSFNQIRIKLEEMRIKEDIFHDKLNKILNDERYQSLPAAGQSEKIKNYIDNDWVYFKDQNYDAEALKVLEEVIYLFYEFCSRAPFNALKKILDLQIEILGNENPV